MYSHIDKLSKINNLMKIKYSLNSILMYYNNIEKKSYICYIKKNCKLIELNLPEDNEIDFEK